MGFESLRCWVVTCSTTQITILPEKLDILTILGAICSIAAVLLAAAAIRQSAKARNLSTIIEVTRQIYAERQRAQDLGLFELGIAEFHAFQMLHLVEQAAMMINHRLVSGKARSFLRDWLKVELPAMAKQPLYADSFAITEGAELEEMRKLYKELIAEIKREETFEIIHQRKKQKRHKK
ncbi:hypothetical protein O9X90_00825 [Agrobacterium leguminum]|uniref:hypothetical protein n=1 Tax=Agrobacterium TaxID=357 RepID=UPI0022B83329|nr:MULTISPECIES: hypothetical protein [Agrobacterium]MCZ7930844.1 hypothetical protein [Agrobacterium leguminum]MDR5009449.1 hypothetical protein [Agrobacterium tumefaciens]